MIDKKRAYSPKLRPEILITRKFKQQFMTCLQRHPVSLRIATPYIGRIPAFGDIVKFSYFFLREEGITFQLITCPPTTTETSQYISVANAEIIVKLGVDLIIHINPNLHSKVYQFSFNENYKVSFVGSANFSIGGFEKNAETVAMFLDPEINVRVEAELNRLAFYGSAGFAKWKYFYSIKEKGAKDV